ncbi:MAG: hypothetical protein WCA84_09310 [Ignavibacteriaceae bacterium]
MRGSGEGAAGESLFATSISLPDGAWLSFIQDGEIILHHLNPKVEASARG